jgi:hypothetical protein
MKSNNKLTSQRPSIKKYKIIAKISDNDFVKYHSQNINSFIQFLDKKFPDWRWGNVYDAKTGEQISSFTRNKRPYKTVSPPPENPV